MTLLTKKYVSTSLILIGVFVLLNLGNWQIYRLNWKQDLISNLKQSSQMSPILIQELKTLSSHQIKQFEFMPVIVEGQYLYSLEFKLLGRTYQGQSGYHLITPFLLKTREILLIDRGWVPSSEKIIYRPLGNLKIKGFIRLNSEKNFFTPENDFLSKELYFIDPYEIKVKAHLRNLLPFYICTSENFKIHTFPLSIPLNCNLRNFHLAYALTWYSLALALGVIYYIFRRKSS
ncbi:MAG: hypothetical protein BGO77_01535 [Caedibacter sp. 37-49]|nr:MAG: hypothetical protein BGO77_01535 [Caedibacter sp. 37-49]